VARSLVGGVLDELPTLNAIPGVAAARLLLDRLAAGAQGAAPASA